MTSKPDVERLRERRDVDGLVRALGFRGDLAVRRAAAQALISCGREAAPACVDALEEAGLREGAIEALIGIGPPALDALIQALKSTRSADARMAAARALAGIGSLAVEPLAAMLRHPSVSVQEAAATALAELREFAVEPLVRMVTSSVEPDYVRRSATLALGRIGGEQVVAVLTAVQARDRAASVREAAAAALQALGWKPEQRRRSSPDVAPAAPSAPAKAAPPRPPHLERWTRFRTALFRLDPVPDGVIGRLRQAYPVHRAFSSVDQVVQDVDEAFSDYSRVREAAYAAVSTHLVFDNASENEGIAAPATRQLEVITVKEGAHFHVFYNATFVEVW